MNAEFACDTEPFREWWRTATAMLRSVHDVEGRGWTTAVTEWPNPVVGGIAEHPVVPLDVPGVPRGYFAVATKA